MKGDDALELSNLNNADLKSLQQAMTPKFNKFMPIRPTAKQTAALLMNSIREMLYG